MKRIVALLYLLLVSTFGLAQSSKQILDFEFEGVVLNGVLNQPKDQKPKGIILVIHGSGETNAVAQDWYSDIRQTLVKAGYATYMWDKMGCGNSGGTFDINQPVQNSALETIAAINTLKARKIPGFEKIGLYGGSRASWINPLVFSQYEDIAFWISISGVDDKENFGYLLAQNLRISGVPGDSIEMMVNEWLAATKINHSGGTYEEAVAATTLLSKNAFWNRFTNGGITAEQYYQYQPNFMNEELDEETGLPIVVKGFESMLSKIDCPVLALFGENDMNVDWKKTKALYEKVLAPNTDLTIQSFQGCNHNMLMSNTGGFYEFQDNDMPYIRCEGFLEAIEGWLRDL